MYPRRAPKAAAISLHIVLLMWLFYHKSNTNPLFTNSMDRKFENESELSCHFNYQDVQISITVTNNHIKKYNNYGQLIAINRWLQQTFRKKKKQVNYRLNSSLIASPSFSSMINSEFSVNQRQLLSFADSYFWIVLLLHHNPSDKLGGWEWLSVQCTHNRFYRGDPALD